MDEVWKPIPGYNGSYEVSNLGRVKTIFRGGHIKSQRLSQWGYPIINLCLNGKLKTHIVSRLVAASFIDNPHNKKEVNHIDGNKTNNRVDNLEWVTPSENVKHSYDTGLTKKRFGAKHHHAVFTDSQALEIKKRFNAGGISKADLSREFNVSHGAICDLIKERTYPHLKLATKIYATAVKTN